MELCHTTDFYMPVKRALDVFWWILFQALHGWGAEHCQGPKALQGDLSMEQVCFSGVGQSNVARKVNHLHNELWS